MIKPNNCFLIEDHHKALSIWRHKKVRNLDLIHIDAHIDFGFHLVKPLKQAVEDAKSIKDLKQSLERSLVFSRYEKDFDKQTNIGNYIYPAMREGIVRNFYWVIPGSQKEFNRSKKHLKGMVKTLILQDPYRRKANVTAFYSAKSLSAPLMNRRFVITSLENLPIFRRETLLDIDTDFLVIDKLKNADATSLIGRRKPWVTPQELAKILKARVKHPKITTIAYSVNGGFTPLKYKHLGDEIAYRLFPDQFKKRFRQAVKVAQNYERFLLNGKASFYHEAVRLNPAFRQSDNNYGNLYLCKGRLREAEREFQRILTADRNNPFSLAGLGRVCLRRKNYKRAKMYFSRTLKLRQDYTQAISGLAEAEFLLRNLEKAKQLFLKLKTKEPFNPNNYFFLGRIYQQKGSRAQAAKLYLAAFKLGLNHADMIKRLLRVCPNSKMRDAIVHLARARHLDTKGLEGAGKNH